MNIEKFIEIFSGLNIAYGKFIPEDKNDAGKLQGKNQIVRQPDGLPRKLWEDHLSGTASLGVIPIDENNKCRWGCIDIDRYNGFDHLKLIKKIRDNKLPLIVFRSKSGGAHVFMFFTVPVKAGLVQSRLKEFSAFLGCAGSEIFPKQVKLLLDKGQTGNYLNLPYFDADKSTRYALDDEGNPCALEDFFKLYDKYSQNNADIEYLKIDDKFKDGPPCLNTLYSNGVPEGGRDEAITNVAVFFKKSGKTDFLFELGAINNEMCDPPLTQGEVQKIEQSVKKKEYDYACNKEPLCSNCNRSECFKRKFGKGETELDIVPTGLEKYGSEPPLWFLSLDGVDKPLELETEDLQNQIRFQRRCMEQNNTMPKIIPAPRWTEKIGAILSNATHTPIKGVSNTEQFIEYLKEWCTNKGAAETKEELALGKPWLNRESNSDRKHHFFLKDLEDFLQKKKFTVFHRNKMVRIIEQELKGIKKTVRIKKPDGDVTPSVWTIPEFIDDMEDIQVATPDMKEKESY
jgi:hypothetical protein|tara:strand:- start:2002 stop:3543 length:1542 start_codon:yes stop_codon:yes gene_type:complete